MNDQNNKVALVTGAARMHGMGRAIALRLARDGADVVVAGKFRPMEEFPEWEKQEQWLGLESVVKEIEFMDRRSMAMTVDISNHDEVDHMVHAIISQFGRIDILVNNAGIASTTLGEALIVEIEQSVWQKALDMNLTGPFLCSKAMAQEMIKRGEGGKIVNIASIMAKVVWPGRGAYCASKFGLLALTQTMALELASHGINVNAVCPGSTTSDPGAGNITKMKSIEWGISEQDARERFYAEAAKTVPLGRVATPEDIADVVSFLASSQSDYMTGQAINVTGGRVMH